MPNDKNIYLDDKMPKIEEACKTIMDGIKHGNFTLYQLRFMSKFAKSWAESTDKTIRRIEEKQKTGFTSEELK